MKDTGERLIPKGHHKSLTYGEHLSRYLTASKLAKGKVVLDIASGAGYGTKILSKEAKKVYGVDYSQDAINYAKENYNSQNIEYKVGDALDIPLPDNSIDLVVSLETIEHLTDSAKFIQEVKRVLKDDGQFVVSTPNDDEYIEGNEFHLHEFDLKELKKLITDNFKHSDYYYQGSFFSAAMLDKETFQNGGNSQTIVEKTFGQPLTKAIYYLAIASNKPVSKLSPTTVIADAWNTKDDLARDKQLQKHIKDLNDKVSELEPLLGKVQQLEHELSVIKSSKGWRAVSAAYKAKSKASTYVQKKRSK